MTTGTIHTLDPDRGTGTLRCIAGTLVPFSTRETDLRAGDRVTFRLLGGIAGLYADHVEHAAVRAPVRRQRDVVLPAQIFRSRAGSVAALAG